MEYNKVKEFINAHSYDGDLKNLIYHLKKSVKNNSMLHSDRWSWTYDFFKEYYPQYSDLITDFVYYIEKE